MGGIQLLSSVGMSDITQADLSETPPTSDARCETKVITRYEDTFNKIDMHNNPVDLAQDILQLNFPDKYEKYFLVSLINMMQ